jgi:nucleoid DNA-binding protein
MTKLEIVTNLYEKLGFSKRECANIVDTFRGKGKEGKKGKKPADRD